MWMHAIKGALLWCLERKRNENEVCGKNAEVGLPPPERRAPLDLSAAPAGGRTTSLQMGCGSSRVVPHESPRSHLKSVSDTAIATSRGRLRLPKFSPIHKKLTEAGHTKGDTTDLEQTDLPVIGALADGTIRLVSVDWLLKRPHSWRAVRLQELEQLKGALLAPKDAAKAMGSSHRRVFVLSYGWLSKSSPDPFGVRLHAVRSALRQLRKAKLLPSGCGLFWDFLSIPQKPRTSAEDEVFKKGLAFMAALYASPLGACVLQMKAIPPRPEALVGSMRVCRLREGLASNHAAMTKAYKKYGEIERVEKVDEDEVVVRRRALPPLGASARLTRGPGANLQVHFRAAASRKQALIMDPKALGLGADSWACDEYNERVYSQRGWCVFEDAVSFEFLGRCTKAGNESMQLAMHQPNMPDKVYEISSLPLKTPGREVYKQQVHADVARRLDAATFIGKGDQQKVLDLYKTFQRDAAATAIRHRADLPGTPGKGAGPLPPIRGASNGRPGTPGTTSAAPLLALWLAKVDSTSWLGEVDLWLSRVRGCLGGGVGGPDGTNPHLRGEHRASARRALLTRSCGRRTSLTWVRRALLPARAPPCRQEEEGGGAGAARGPRLRRRQVRDHLVPIGWLASGPLADAAAHIELQLAPGHAGAQ